VDTALDTGLLPGFRWIVRRRFVWTLLACWLITPVGHCVVGLVLESRWVPLGSDLQFVSFFPGDIFLGLMAAGLLTLAGELRQEARFYNSPWFHAAILIVTMSVAAYLTWGEWQSGFYPDRAIISPTKLYHNIVLYGGYGYVIITALTAVVVQFRGWMLVFVFLPGIMWAERVVADNSLSPEVAAVKAAHAHVADWEPIWVSWKIRFDGI
jgi:hypothetical protein